MDFTVVVDKLNQMNTQELHGYLVEQGVVGIRGDGETCPIAEYIKAVTGFKYVTVDCFEVQAWEASHAGTQTMVAAVDSSEALGDFLELFDDGHFPELEKDYV